jgi:predicted metal-dependent hydrolase
LTPKPIDRLAPMHPLLRFTLDLFDPAPMVVAKASVAPAVPMGDIMVPANFRHPKANRESRLGDAMVAYEFRRSKRRTIGFSVGPDGLVVSAPKWVPIHQMESALLERSDWILKKLGETRQRRAQLESARIEWRDGTQLPFLGEQLIVVLDPCHAFGNAGAELQAEASSDSMTLPGVPYRTLHVALPHSATPEQIRDAVQAWLMRQAKRIFTERMNHFAPLLGVQWRKLSLSSAGTRWGSASANGSIRLNWRLIHFKMSVIDYVVAHELSHLRVMDHSPRFWDTVRAVVPDYTAHRSALKDDTLPRWN